jgi:hypothetical protein
VSNVAGTSFAYQSAYNGNAIINGGMDIWQRGTSFASQASLGSAAYTADRWHFYRSAGASGATLSRQASGLTGIQYCARLQRDSGNTGTGAINLRYTAESADSYRFAGQTVTVSFYARAGANFSATSNAFVFALASGTGTDQPVYSFTSYATVATTTATLTTSWQRFTATGTVSSSATEVGIEAYYTPTGTAGANDYLEITGVQLELGSVATSFKRSNGAGGTIQGELAACQRYLPSIQAYNLEFASGFAYSTTKALFPVNFQVPTRVAPTGITVNSAGNFTVRNAVASPITVTALAFSTGGLTACCIEATVTAGLVAGNGSNIINSGSGTILFTGCEL